MKLKKRIEKITEHPALLCALVLLVLFLLTERVILRDRAIYIQGEVLEEMETELRELNRNVSAAAATGVSSPEAALVPWQQAMVGEDLSTEERADRPWISASVIIGADDTVAVESANVVIVTFRQSDEATSIPVRFLEDNTADVYSVLSAAKYSFRNVGGIHYVGEMAGYWHMGMFYAERIEIFEENSPYSYKEIEYGAEHVVVGDEDIMAVIPLGSGDCPYGVQFSGHAIMKCAGDAYKGSAVRRKWTDTDQLLARLHASPPTQQDTAITENLYTTELYACSYITDRTGGLSGVIPGIGSGGNRYMVKYIAQVHPMALALRSQMKNGQLPVTALLFLTAFLLLNVLLTQSGRKKISDLEDELARKNTALDYARRGEEARKELTAAVAHELKTPIALMAGYAEALQEGVGPEKEQKYLSVIREEAAAMDAIVLELLDLSRLEAGKYKLQRETFDLRELAEEILEPLQPQLGEKGLQLQWKVENPLVRADRYRMGQVVQNFLTNAIRHTPEGGSITLCIGTGHGALQVINQGEHIPPDQLAHVFERFWQGNASRSGRGTGLGLAICSTIMQLHGGDCQAENVPGGVCFTARLGAPKMQAGVQTVKETVVELTYPIAQESTTVESVMTHLGLLKGRKLRNELRQGRILCDSQAVSSRRSRVRSGAVLTWMEFRITVVQDDELKRRALLQNGLSSGGGLFARSAGMVSGGSTPMK